MILGERFLAYGVFSREKTVLQPQKAALSAQITKQLPANQEISASVQDGRQVWFEGYLGISTHKFFTPSYATEAFITAREAFVIRQRLNYGWAVLPITKRKTMSVIGSYSGRMPCAAGKLTTPKIHFNKGENKWHVV